MEVKKKGPYPPLNFSRKVYSQYFLISMFLKGTDVFINFWKLSVLFEKTYEYCCFQTKSNILVRKSLKNVFNSLVVSV